MTFYKRALAVIMVWCMAFPACAFTFSYGDLFSVKNVTLQDGLVTLPKTQKKYRNVKILSKEVYRFLKTCQTDCRYAAAGKEFVSMDYRKARSREGMLIADVQFNEDIIVTFLVFANKKGFSVKTPQEVTFEDKKLEQEVIKYVEALAQKTL